MMALQGGTSNSIAAAGPGGRVGNGVRWFAILTILALAVRVGYALVAERVDPFLQRDPLLGDAASYDRIARSLAAGQGYAQFPPKPESFWPPLYPVFLSAMYRLAGYDRTAARVIQGAWGAILPGMVYLVGRALLGERAARIAGLGATVYPYHIYFGAWLIAENLFMTLLGLALLAAVAVQKRPGGWASMGLGLVTGLCVLAKPSALFLAPPFVVWFLLAGRLAQKPLTKRVLYIALFLATLAAVLSPWLIRNRITFGGWFISTNGGYTFYGANNAEAFGGHREGFPGPIVGLGEVEQDRAYFRLGLQWIAGHPLDFLVLAGKKIARLLSPLSVASWEQAYPLPGLPLIRVVYGAFLAAAAIALRWLWRRRREIMLLYVPIVGVFASALVYYGDTRYALPMAPSLLLLAAVTIDRLWQCATDGASPRTGATGYERPQGAAPMAHDPQGVHPPLCRTSLERPSLEYQYVFDQCAVAAHRLEDPVVVLAASPFHARELLARLDDCPARLAPAGGWSPTTADLDRMREGEGARFEVWPEDSDVSARMVLCAEPEQGRVEQVFEQLESMMAPGGALYIIARGPAARFLPEARSVALPAAGTRRVLATLRRRGYTVEAQYGYHGLASMAWGYAYRLLERLGRKGLADRCFYAGWARYVVSGGRAWWAPVRLIVARKGRPKALPPRAGLAASGSSSHG